MTGEGHHDRNPRLCGAEQSKIYQVVSDNRYNLY